jgi:tetratricopeptide (TPR) repeat protein
MQGKSLRAEFNGERADPKSVYSESRLAEFHYGWSPLRSITTTEYRFIEAPTAELYDRQTDRSETKNIADQKPEIVQALRNELNVIIQTSSQSNADPGKIDPDTEEKLKALGYVGATVKSTPVSRLSDPKDKIGVLTALNEAKNANEAQNYPLVITILTRVLQQEPQLVDAHYMAANAHLHLGNMELALQEFLTVIKLKPDHTQALYNLGFFYHVQENFTAAEHWYKQLLVCEPDHLFGNLNLASIYIQKGEKDKAQPIVEKIVSDYERSIQTAASPEIRSKLLEKLSEIRFKTGNAAQSKLDLEESVKADSKNYQAWWKLGALYRQDKRFQDAIECFEKAIELNEEFYPAYYSLSALYLATNTKLPEALRLVEKANEKEKTKQGEQLRAAILTKLQQKQQ